MTDPPAPALSAGDCLVTGWICRWVTAALAGWYDPPEYGAHGLRSPLGRQWSGAGRQSTARAGPDPGMCEPAMSGPTGMGPRHQPGRERANGA